MKKDNTCSTALEYCVVHNIMVFRNMKIIYSTLLMHKSTLRMRLDLDPYAHPCPDWRDYSNFK